MRAASENGQNEPTTMVNQFEELRRSVDDLARALIHDLVPAVQNVQIAVRRLKNANQPEYPEDF